MEVEVAVVAAVVVMVMVVVASSSSFVRRRREHPFLPYRNGVCSGWLGGGGTLTAVHT